MSEPWIARRLEALPKETVLGLEVAVAVGFCSRLQGLARLSREQAGAGLLVPRCSSVHTFGMRFPLDLVFLDERSQPLSTRFKIPPRRFAFHPGAFAVLEVPSLEGGDSLWVLGLDE